MGTLKINMLGTSFTVQGNEDTEYLDRLLGYYKRITDDIQKGNKVKNPVQISILAGIMLCDELYKEKSRNICEQDGDVKQNPLSTPESEEVEQHTLDMIRRIDGVLD